MSARQGLLSVAVAATAWGTGGAVAAVLYDIGGIGPGAVSFWRFSGGLVLLLLARSFHDRFRRVPADSLLQVFLENKREVLLAGCGLALYQTAYFAAVQQVGLTVATVVTLGTGPVLVALGSRLLLDEPVGIAGVCAAVCGVAGLVLLVCGADRAVGPAPAFGLVLAVVSASGYAGVTLLGRAAGLRRRGSRLTGLVLNFAVGTLCLLPVALAEGLLPRAEGLGWTAVSIGYLGLVPTALAYGLFFAGLEVLSATTVSVVALIEPLTAAIIGVLVLQERLTWGITSGSALVLSAVFFLGRTSQPEGEVAVGAS
ncbi:DMT family transporter [Streptomyces sp. NPDC059894]|uniref:DMT family transporter n=1 Tax=unclassified Streptomyces TaxID=2593676 RepID=UPI0036585452